MPRVDGFNIVYAGARRPDRSYRVDAGGVGIATYEWGSAHARPLFLVHGGFDFAGTFDLLAPLLADAGWRVVGWDQRGHGDSDRTALYSFDADIRDALAVIDSVTAEPCVIVGHSKGGGLMLQLADTMPHRVSHLINLDGLPWRLGLPDVPAHERTKMAAADVEAWLDHRRATALASRKPGTIDDLARRRHHMNPRLSTGWLRYIATIGAAKHDDGWRWKVDPSLRFGGFGPWRPDWLTMRMAGLPMPFLAILALQEEPMGWGTKPEDIAHLVPPQGRVEAFEDSGHFLHIEFPERTAERILAFLDEHGARP